MKIAHDKGVRLLAAYPTTATSYFADPTSDSVLRMFEELGMPIIHPGKCIEAGECVGGNFWEYVPINSYFTSCGPFPENITESCNDDPLYPVDMWLYDHRLTFKVPDPDFALGFPDKAFIKGQSVVWRGGGKIY